MESILRTWLLEFAPLVVVTLGFFVSMRVLRFPDLTLDASFSAGNVGFFLGASTAGSDLMGILISGLLGGVAGLFTGTIYSLHPTGVFKILASVLVMYGFYSINFRLLGDNSKCLSDGTTSIITTLHGIEGQFSAHWYPLTYLFALVFAGIVVLLVYLFLKSATGIKVRTAGWSPSLLTISGHSEKRFVILGLVAANVIIALGGWLDGAIHQRSVINEEGIIIDAIAALLLGELVIDSIRQIRDRRISIKVAMWSPVIGSMLYVLLKIVSQDFLDSQLKIFIVSDRYALVSVIILVTVLIARAESSKYHDNASGEAL